MSTECPVRAGCTADLPPWEEALRSGLRAAFSAPDLAISFLETHRKEHRLAQIWPDKCGPLFVKAFAPEARTAFRNELSVYRQLDESGAAPRLVHVDEVSRWLVTEAGVSTRLDDVPEEQLRRHLPRLPALYAALVGLRSGRPRTDHATRLAKHHAVVKRCREAEGLPSPDVVLRVLGGLAELPVHGDFQPTNLLAGSSSVLAVDFESYGPGLPAVDVARIAYNPVLPLAMHERASLTAEMLDRLAHQWGVTTSSRQLAAACVYWAVTCAGYFRRLIADPLRSGAVPADAAVLATRPLELAVALWNQEV